MLTYLHSNREVILSFWWEEHVDCFLLVWLVTLRWGTDLNDMQLKSIKQINVYHVCIIPVCRTGRKAAVHLGTWLVKGTKSRTELRLVHSHIKPFTWGRETLACESPKDYTALWLANWKGFHQLPSLDSKPLFTEPTFFSKLLNHNFFHKNPCLAPVKVESREW